VCVEGSSTGGSVAQQFAIDHPQLVRRLVLAATACRLSPHGREVQRRFAELVRQGRPGAPTPPSAPDWPRRRPAAAPSRS
jgi:pimeloyl-ACP methyl ester carboxylesterase